MRASLPVMLGFQAISAVSQVVVTHITQVTLYTDLPLCLHTAVSTIFDDLRISQCLQTNPASAASCICLKTANSAIIYTTMSIYVLVWCAGEENLSSGLAVFDEYCTEAMDGKAATVPVTSTAAVVGGGIANAPVASNTDFSNPAVTPNTSPDSPQSSGSASSSSFSSGLSLGEKVAVGVAIPATLAAIIGSWYAWRQYRLSRKDRKERQYQQRYHYQMAAR